MAVEQLPAQKAGGPGTIDLHVVAPGTASASGLLVVLALAVPDDMKAWPRVFAAVTDKLGLVHFANLAFGTYNVCVETLHAEFVDSCRWSAPDRVQLKSKHTSDLVNITLQRGVPIEIRVDDPSQLLTTAARQGKSALSVHILTPVGYQPLMPWAEDIGGHNYRIIAPANVAAKIRVDAGQLQVTDSFGQTADSLGHISQFTAVPSDSSKFLRFSVHDSK